MDDGGDDGAYLEAVEVVGHAPGAALPLTSDDVTIGRWSEGDISINSVALARRHARIVKRGNGYLLVDNRTQNGTRLNGKRINTPQPLKEGDVIELAKDAVLRFHRTRSPSPFFAIEARGDWVIFNSAGPADDGVFHALHVDGRHAYAWPTGSRAACGAIGRPRFLEDLPGGGVVVEDAGGVSYRRLFDGLNARSESVEPSLVAAAAVASMSRGTTGYAPFQMRFSFAGNILMFPRRGMDNGRIDNGWCASIARYVGTMLCLPDPNARYGDGAPAVCAQMLKRLPATPFAGALAKVLDVGAASGDENELRAALAALATACGCNDDGGVDPRYVASVVAEVCPVETAAAAAFWEHALLLGAPAVLAQRREVADKGA